MADNSVPNNRPGSDSVKKAKINSTEQPVSDPYRELPKTNRRKASSNQSGRVLNLTTYDKLITPESLDSQSDLLPENQSRRALFEGSGRTYRRKEGNEPVNDYSRQVQTTNSNQGAVNDYSNKKRSGSPRRQDLRRKQTSEREVGRRIAQNALKSKGNVAKFSWNTLRDKELRGLLLEYKWPLFFAIVGDVADVIPIIGIIINVFCWVLVYFAFKVQNKDFVGRVTKDSAGVLNIVAEVILGSILFWPGLVIGTVQTIFSDK